MVLFERFAVNKTDAAELQDAMDRFINVAAHWMEQLQSMEEGSTRTETQNSVDKSTDIDGLIRQGLVVKA